MQAKFHISKLWKKLKMSMKNIELFKIRNIFLLWMSFTINISKKRKMIEKMTFAEKVLQFNSSLSNETLDLPVEFKVINPFSMDQKE